MRYRAVTQQRNPAHLLPIWEPIEVGPWRDTREQAGDDAKSQRQYPFPSALKAASVRVIVEGTDR